MTNLISGKEALIALANGEEVEYLYGENNWLSVIEMQVLITAFTGSKFKFRLKPRTITINGIEVPAPFEPEEGETYWFITDSECGYNWVENKQGCRVGIAAWRTEEEIKQVVAALRQIFGRSDDAVNAVRGWEMMNWFKWFVHNSIVHPIMPFLPKKNSHKTARQKW